jgi:type I restriction enzyme S subunit
MSEVPEGWRIEPLRELVDARGITYGVVQPGPFVEDGVPLVRVSDFKSDGIRREALVRIDPAIAARYGRSTLSGSEVLITLVGTVGLVAVATDELVGCNVARAVGVVPVSDPLTARWVALSLQGPTVRRFFVDRLNTTVQKTLNLRDVASLRIPFPPAPEMRTITELLGALDDKIESNARVAAGLAAAFAAAWGRSTAGASTLPLDEIAESVRVPGAPEDDYIGLDDMPRGSTVLHEWKTPDQAPKGGSWAFEPGDILFGKLRPYFKKVGVAPIAGRCTREILVVRPRAPNDYGVVLGALTSDAFIDHCVAVSSGTRMPRSEWRDAARFAVPAIDEHRRRELEELARCNYSLVSSFTLESRRLAVIRGALLPRLVSGRIRVPLTNDLDEAVETVLDAI